MGFSFVLFTTDYLDKQICMVLGGVCDSYEVEVQAALLCHCSHLTRKAMDFVILNKGVMVKFDLNKVVLNLEGCSGDKSHERLRGHSFIKEVCHWELLEREVAAAVGSNIVTSNNWM